MVSNICFPRLWGICIHPSVCQHFSITAFNGHMQVLFIHGVQMDRGVGSNFWLWVRGPKEQNCTNTIQTYPQTGHLSSLRHSLDIFLAPILCDSQYKLFFIYLYIFCFSQTIFSYFLLGGPILKKKSSG